MACVPDEAMCAVIVPGRKQLTQNVCIFVSFDSAFFYCYGNERIWLLATARPLMHGLPSMLILSPRSTCHSTRWLSQHSKSRLHILKLMISCF